MSRLVDADKVIEALRQEAAKYTEPLIDPYKRALALAYRSAIDEMMRAHEVAARPIKYGYWGWKDTGKWYCSECKTVFDRPMEGNNYCPHCGSDMHYIENLPTRRR